MRNLLATCGKFLTAEELTNGLKTNQVLFEKSAFQYHLKNVPIYDNSTFPYLDCGVNFFSIVWLRHDLAKIIEPI